MTAKRTDDQIFTKAPLILKLGTATYEVPIKTITAQMKWRQKLHEAMVPIVNGFGEAAGSAAMSGGMAVALLKFPEVVLDLVLAYSPSITREAVLDEENGATEEQVSKAFSQIMEVAYPFLSQLATVRNALQAVAETRR